MPGASGEANADQKTRVQWRTELYTGKTKDSKYNEPVKEAGLLTRWPKFLKLQCALPDPGGTAALLEMRQMCPGKPITLEEIAAMCLDTPYRTPFWKGQTAKTDIAARDLSPAEVEVINDTYLMLNTAFLAKRQGQAAGEAIAEAEQNLTAQNLRAQELLTEIRREMNAGLNEIKVMVKKKKHGEEYWYIRAVGGTHFKHESGYFHEVGHLNAEERFDKVLIVSKNTDGTWAYRGKYGIGVAPASEFKANPGCDGKKVTVSEGRNRGQSFLCDRRHRRPVATYPEAARATPLLPYLVLLRVGFT